MLPAELDADLLDRSPKESQWIAKPLKPIWGIQHVAFTGLFVQLAIHLPRLLNEWTGKRGASLITIGLLLILAAVAFVACLRELAIRRQKATDLAIPDGSFGDQFPVEMTIVVEADRIGADRSVVWFADGLMGFSGSAASFVLEATDIAPQGEKLRMKTFRMAMPHGAILLCGAPKVAYVIVRPLLGHTKAYRERLAEFIRADEEPGGERFWPPLTRYLPEEAAPQAVVRRN